MSQPISLTVQHRVELFPSAPFFFDATLPKPDHFPSADNQWRPAVRGLRGAPLWGQTTRWRDMPLGLTFENRGTVDRSRMVLSIRSRK